MRVINHNPLPHKVEASITDEIREFAFFLDGIIAGKTFLAKRNIFQGEYNFLFMNMEIAANFEAVEFKVTHSRSISQLISTHLNVDSWLE